MDEKRIAQLMKSLDCTREEAIQVIMEDEAIDKGEKLFELSAEQKKVAKAVSGTGTRKRTEIKRERKVDETKKRLLNAFRIYIEGSGGTVEPLTTEAEMHFTFEGDNYTVKLVKHRKGKGE